MRIIVAPDSFKGSITAHGAARALSEGWLSVRLDDDVTVLPQADGGEGTLDAIAASVPDARLRDAGSVTGPDGRPTRGEWLQLPDGTAVVELAQTSGLPLMQALDPRGATTRGLGEVIASALDAGAARLIVGLGGSASTDGGAGALAALGLRLLDAEGRELPDGGAALASLARVDASRLRPPPPRGVRVLTDVTAPLLGPRGAAAVFGPQKGATPDDVAHLDAALATFAAQLTADPTLPLRPGSGAAGGAGFGFLGAWGAVIEAGSAAIGAMTGLDAAVASADLVITGEGRFDATSLTGKVVGHVLELAGARALVVAGVLGADPGVRSVALAGVAGSVGSALAEPERWLRVAGAELAREVR